MHAHKQARSATDEARSSNTMAGSGSSAQKGRSEEGIKPVLACGPRLLFTLAAAFNVPNKYKVNGAIEICYTGRQLRFFPVRAHVHALQRR
jgi:hypothetical protein